MCQPEYDITDVSGVNDEGKCAKKAAAYLIEGGTCKYSFGLPEFSASRSEDTNKQLSFDLAYTSAEPCEDGLFTYTVQGVCSKNGETTPKINTNCSIVKQIDNEATCLKEVNYRGPYELVKKFFGVILIVNGALLCFAGSQYLFIALSGLIFLVVTGAIAGAANGLNFVSKDSPKY